MNIIWVEYCNKFCLFLYNEEYYTNYGTNVVTLKNISNSDLIRIPEIYAKNLHGYDILKKYSLKLTSILYQELLK